MEGILAATAQVSTKVTYWWHWKAHLSAFSLFVHLLKDSSLIRFISFFLRLSPTNCVRNRYIFTEVKIVLSPDRDRFLYLIEAE